MAEDRNLRIRVVVNKDGTLTVFKDLASDVGDFEGAATKAGRAAEKVLSALEKDAPISRKQMQELKRSVEEYGNALQEAEKAGRTIGPEQAEQFKALESVLHRATEATGAAKDRTAQLAREYKNFGEEAGTARVRVGGLDDIISELAEDMGPAAIKFTAWGTAAAGAFTAGYQAGGKLRDMLNTITDGGFDKWVQDTTPGMNDMADSIANMGHKTSEAADKAQLLKNQLHILRKEGIDPTGMSAEEVQHKVDELGKKMLKASEDAQTFGEKVREAIKGSGVESKKELDEQAKVIQEAIKQIGAANKQLSEQDILKIMGPKIEALADKYKELKIEVPDDFKAISDAWNASAQAAGQAADKHVAAADKSAAALGQLSKAAQMLTKELLAQAPVLQQNTELENARADAAARTAKELTDAVAADNNYAQSMEATAKSYDALGKALVDGINKLNQMNTAANKAAAGLSAAAKAASEGWPDYQFPGSPEDKKGDSGSDIIVTEPTML